MVTLEVWVRSALEFGVGCARRRGRVCLKWKRMHKEGVNRNAEKDRGRNPDHDVPEAHLVLGFSVSEPLLALPCGSLCE